MLLRHGERNLSSHWERYMQKDAESRGPRMVLVHRHIAVVRQVIVTVTDTQTLARTPRTSAHLLYKGVIFLGHWNAMRASLDYSGRMRQSKTRPRQSATTRKLQVFRSNLFYRRKPTTRLTLGSAKISVGLLPLHSETPLLKGFDD
jgi:hypothetical protein